MTKYIVRDIERAVCLRFKITPERLRGRECQRKIARPRQIAMALARELTGASLPQIGRHFGRDHTTVLHACRKIKSMVEEGGRMAQYLDEVRAILLGLTPVKQEIAQSVATLHQQAQAELPRACDSTLAGESPVAGSRASEGGGGQEVSQRRERG